MEQRDTHPDLFDLCSIIRDVTGSVKEIGNQPALLLAIQEISFTARMGKHTRLTVPSLGFPHIANHRASRQPDL
jgi:hypothetical protein